MDQEVIQSFKCHYRKLIVQKHVGANDRREFVISLNIKTALSAATASWDSVIPQVLKRVWNNLISHNEDAPKSHVEIQTDITIRSRCTIDAVEKWMVCDSDVAPFAIISEEEIVDIVSQSQEDELVSNAEESDGGNADETPTLAQAIEASSILLGFLENFNCPPSIS